MNTTARAILLWATRTARCEEVEGVHHFDVDEDGFVYAMPAPEASDPGYLACWPIPYLGPDGESALRSGDIYGEIEVDS